MLAIRTTRAPTQSPGEVNTRDWLTEQQAISLTYANSLFK